MKKLNFLTKMFWLLMALSASVAVFNSCESDAPNDPTTGGAVSTISLNTNTLSLPVGGDETLFAILTPAGAIENVTVTWSSSSPAVATVSGSGKVTAISEGGAIITARVGSKTATCVVFVSNDIIIATEISLNKTALALAVGGRETLEATVTPADAHVTWTSSNPTIATVVNGTVIAIAAGTATITARSGSQTATCTVIVSNNVVNTHNMTGKINEESFAWRGDARVMGNEISLGGRSDGENYVPRIVLYVPTDVVAGRSYPIGPDEDCTVLFMDIEGWNIYGSEGMITITEYNKTLQTIKGTFHFSTEAGLFTPAYFITEGSFSYVYEIWF